MRLSTGGKILDNYDRIKVQWFHSLGILDMHFWKIIDQSNIDLKVFFI